MIFKEIMHFTIWLIWSCSLTRIPALDVKKFTFLIALPWPSFLYILLVLISLSDPYLGVENILKSLHDLWTYLNHFPAGMHKVDEIYVGHILAVTYSDCLVLGRDIGWTNHALVSQLSLLFGNKIKAILYMMYKNEILSIKCHAVTIQLIRVLISFSNLK